MISSIKLVSYVSLLKLSINKIHDTSFIINIQKYNFYHWIDTLLDSTFYTLFLIIMLEELLSLDSYLEIFFSILVSSFLRNWTFIYVYIGLQYKGRYFTSRPLHSMLFRLAWFFPLYIFTLFGCCYYRISLLSMPHFTIIA